ncbi:hypothetical protein [Blastococcus xanthinilyticus]|uniref:Uncharacterized protein n=1 Tax=Blastococcus xanthinilyticus TaxID=1564164 RepID=A0A5S5D5H7_9ACTN|nr:hypothetical protein [Blastococcus xanthinilyticus]TYP90406.1 hypothetical protein BD833_101124 [Blastococcus xanthinilyticus]
MSRQETAVEPDRPGAEVPTDAGRRSRQGALVLMVLGAAALVSQLDGPTHQRLGPWLDSLSAWQRAALGLAVGAVAAAPRLLKLLPEVWRRVRWPVDAVTVLAGIWVCTVWINPRGGSGFRWAEYRDDAGWFIPASVATFLAVVVAVEVLASRARARREQLAYAALLARERAEVSARRRRR